MILSWLTIVVVTYNSEPHIRACLESVARQSIISDCNIVVFDNASTDGTLNVCREFTLKNYSVIESEENLGFGVAINRSVAAFPSDYVYLLNPDAVLASSSVLEELLAYAISHPAAAIIGSQVIGPNGRVIGPGRKYPEQTKMSIDFTSLPGDIPWLIGASLLVNKLAFDSVQGFDEDYFLYGEEVDLCLRLRKKGYELAYYPDVSVEHVGSGSADQLGSYNKKVLKTKGRYLFCYKHYPCDEVRHMICRDGRRACLRYWLTRFIFPKKAAVYKAVWDVARKTLSH